MASLLVATGADATPTMICASPVGSAAAAVEQVDHDIVLWRWDEGLVPTAAILPNAWIADARFGPDGHLWIATHADPGDGTFAIRDLDGGPSFPLPSEVSSSGVQLAFIGPSPRVIGSNGV